MSTNVSLWEPTLWATVRLNDREGTNAIADSAGFF